MSPAVASTSKTPFQEGYVGGSFSETDDEVVALAVHLQIVVETVVNGGSGRLVHARDRTGVFGSMMLGVTRDESSWQCSRQTVSGMMEVRTGGGRSGDHTS